MAITYDDGPYHYTNDLLDLLESNGVVATFFVTGVNGAKGAINDPSTPNPSVLHRMLANGHQIASHSWSHEDMEAITDEQRRAQIINNEIALADLFGFFPTYYRPPYTSCGWNCYEELSGYGYHVVNYNLDTKDYHMDVSQARMNYAQGVDGVATRAAGIITLAHDIHADTVYSLSQFMIDKARENGLKLVTVGECLGDSQGNWYRNARTGQPVDASSILSAGAGGATRSPTERKGKGTGRSQVPKPSPTRGTKSDNNSGLEGKANEEDQGAGPTAEAVADERSAASSMIKPLVSLMVAVAGAFSFF